MQGTYGVMTHFWATAGGAALNYTVIRYYLDDESTNSHANSSSIHLFPISSHRLDSILPSARLWRRIRR